MEQLIKQAFLHVDVVGPHVYDGHYDLIGPDGEIILPEVWDSTIQPGWSVTMHMWPMPEEPSKTPPPEVSLQPSDRPEVVEAASDHVQRPPIKVKSRKVRVRNKFDRGSSGTIK